MLNVNLPSFWIERLPTIIVGATLLWTSGIKAFAPQTFRNHLASLGWIPWGFLSPLVSAAAMFEAAWGAVLILGIAPRVILPLSISAFGILSLVAWWSVRSGKADDCGCYGGFIQPS